MNHLSISFTDVYISIYSEEKRETKKKKKTSGQVPFFRNGKVVYLF